MRRILSISRNPRLLSARNDALALAGYSVASPREAEEAPLLFSQEDFDAVILGHSIDSNTRRELIDHFRAWKPSICILFAYTGNTEAEPLADVSVDISAGPMSLLVALEKLLRESNSARGHQP